MKTEILKIKQMMKDLTDIKDKFTTQGSKDITQEIIVELKGLAELCDY